MKRWLSYLFIASYLTALSAGVACHALGFGLGSHPAMYYLVWDMFCGWTAYEGRLHVVGEGESGRYYELSPGPWGDFNPYGHVGRRHYDSLAMHGTRFGLNSLAHARHEPITRMFVIEENFAKKYNLPDTMYEQQFGEWKNPQSYYHVRLVTTPEGKTLSVQDGWLAQQFQRSLMNNPRLVADAQRSKPFYPLGAVRADTSVMAMRLSGAERHSNAGSPSGN